MADKTKKRGRRNGKNGSARPKPWEPLPRDLEIYALVTAGNLTYLEIAEKFDMTGANVSHIAKKIDAWLVPQWMDDIRRIKARHTESLMVVFREAMNAWEASKLDEVTTKVEDIVADGVVEGSKETVTRKKTAGNPSFLSQARAALADIRKIWGADEPVEHRHSGEIRVAGKSRHEVWEQLSERFASMAEASAN